MDLECFVVSPSTQHTHTVIFLHGRSDRARPFAESLTRSRDSQGRTLFEIFPSFRWVFPSSQIRELASCPGLKWSQWFDLWDARDFSTKAELQIPGLIESVTSVRRVIASELENLDGQSERLILAGISQGAATLAHTLLNLNLTPANGQAQQPRPSRALGAFIGFSCRMPFPGRTLADTRSILGLDGVPDHDDIIRNTPMLLEHYVNDSTVPITNGQILRDTLRQFGADVTWKEYPDGGHWFHSPTGIDDVVAFVNSRVLAITPDKQTTGLSTVTISSLEDAMDLS